MVSESSRLTIASSVLPERLERFEPNDLGGELASRLPSSTLGDVPQLTFVLATRGQEQSVGSNW